MVAEFHDLVLMNESLPMEVLTNVIDNRISENRYWHDKTKKFLRLNDFRINGLAGCCFCQREGVKY